MKAVDDALTIQVGFSQQLPLPGLAEPRFFDPNPADE
jgi:hypothetical protein